MEMKSPPPCPPTVTIRRNPPRKARATPSSAIRLREPLSSPSPSRDISSPELPEDHSNTDANNADPAARILSENLKIYLRIRPPAVQKNCKVITELKNAWPKNPKIKCNLKPKTKKGRDVCVKVNEDLCSVTVSTPQALQETKRSKSEVYEGFSHVFTSEASQGDVYDKMVKPLVDDFLKGKSGMLAAMGPSGSGKTHTVFGCARDPGMVSLALRHIFIEKESNQTQLSRMFYLSMFEISSERRKAERMIDLLHDGGDIYMQNSVLKGLQEVVISDAQQAESLIAHGMLKRATAITNSNCQSSRSQCIINIRCVSEDSDEEVGRNGRCGTLTIVDLAGAEREKKTGNQGARLLESNFINNTSMVFGLCLRSLLEHQKNRNKPLQKHYKNSLLTRYMQDYMEGKKRMMLILTVKPSVEDYLDTSFLLRQASPFTKIKFQTVQETVNLTCNKRYNQTMPRAEQLKKMKLGNHEDSLIDGGKFDRGFQFNMPKEIAGKVVKDGLDQNSKEINDENLNELHVLSDGLGYQEKPSTTGNYDRYMAEKDREYQIMQGLSKALWTVLKQYKKKLEGIEIENCHLRDNLTNEKTRNLNLENELGSEKNRVLDLENELQELKSQCTCCRKASAGLFPLASHDASSNLSEYQTSELQEVNSEVSSYSMKELEQTENDKKTDPLLRDSDETFASCSGEAEDHSHQGQSCSCSLLLEDFSDSSNAAQDAREFNHTSAVVICARSQELSMSNDYAQDLHRFDMGGEYMSSGSEPTIQLMSACPHSHNKSEQHATNVVGNSKSLEPQSEFPSNGSCLATSLECESSNSSEDHGNLKDPRTETIQLKDEATDNVSSLVEDQIVSVVAHSHIVHSTSEYPQKDDTCSLVDEEKLNNKEGKEQLEQPVAVIPREGWDAKTRPQFLPKLSTCRNVQHTEKPKRRLLPASSVLLKDISILDIKDGNEKPKGGRGGKRVPLYDKNRTQGSLSLLNLLTSKLDR